MTSSLITFANLMKIRYDQRMVEKLTLSHSPFMAKSAKDEGFMGTTQDIPLIHVNPQGLAASSLALAQTNATNVVSKKFQLETGDYQGSVSFGDKVLKQSRGNEGAFLKNQTAEMDGLHEQMGMVQSTYMYGNGGGSIGVIGSIAGDVITLANPSDVINFEEGMYLVASENDGSDTAHVIQAGTSQVIAVNRADGTVTINDAAELTGEDAGDYLFRAGDFVGNTGTKLFHGLRSFVWHNNTPPVLYGMTRTSDKIRLAGCHIADADVAGLNIEERTMLLGAYMTGRFGAAPPSDAYAHPEDFHELATSLRSQGWHAAKDTTTKFGFTAIECVMGGSTVKIWNDPYCPRGTLFAVNHKNWKVHSTGKMIQPIDADGLNFLRNPTTNDYEYRLVSYMAPCTNAPRNFGRVDLGTL